MLERAIRDEDEPIDLGRKFAERCREHVAVQTDGGGHFEAIAPGQQSREHRYQRREMGAIGNRVHGPMVARDRDEPGATTKFPFVRVPDPELERQQRFVCRERRLHGGQAGKR